HHPVTPAKCGKLSAELGARQQVTQLALAADHDWKPGYSRGWNQSQIGIEIEGVSDGDVEAAQMTRESVSRAQRLQAKQAAAQAKLWDIAQAFEEGAALLNASQVNTKRGRV